MDQSPLLMTKLNIPPLRWQWVSRPRLVKQLSLDPEISLVLVSAPAGFGKTTLLAEWARQIKDEGGRMKDEEYEESSSFILPPSSFICWLSLDEEDNDPVRFFGYLIAGVQRVFGEKLDLRAVQGMIPSLSGPGWEGCLILLVNELEKAVRPCIFVLDDYHQIHAPAIHTMVSWLIDHLPPGCCVAIGSRSTPPLPLSKLRARGKMVELSARDLRFTPQESTRFIKKSSGVDLTAEEIGQLTEGCEGWAAGVQMAALALATRLRQATADYSTDSSLSAGEPDVSSLVSPSGIPSRLILSYLIDEVFAHQPEQIQSFLLQTSIVDRMCAPLCDVLLESRERVESRPQDKASSDDSPSILEYLERQNLFITPLDEHGTWYAYHRLFAGALRTRLEKLHPEWIPELHRQASVWFEAQGLLPEAIQYALAAPDEENAAELMEKVAEGMLARSETNHLTDWLGKLSAESLKLHPLLGISKIWIALMQGDVSAIEEKLAEIEADLSQVETLASARQAQGMVEAIRSFLALRQGPPTETVLSAQRALDMLSPEHLFWRGVASRVLGEAYLRLGDFQGARQAIAQSSEISLAAGDLAQGLSAVCQLAGIQASQGQLRLAERTFLTGFERIRREGWDKHPYTGLLHSGLGSILLEWNRVDEAEEHLKKALAFGETAEFRAVAFSAMPGMARLLLARKDTAGAFSWLNRLDEEVRRQLPPGMPSPMGGLLAKFSLLVRDFENAQTWVDAQGLRFDDPAVQGRENEYFILALTLLERGMGDPGEHRVEQALQLMERISLSNRDQVTIMIELNIARALAELTLRHAEQAFSRMEEALILAQPEGYLRIFIDYGAGVKELLVRMIDHHLLREPLKRYAGEIIAVFDYENPTITGKVGRAPQPAAHPEYTVEPLSERELEVLKLVARGATNQEIANRLFLTVSTVKSHVNHIMNKLCAQNRTEAVTRARELGWIP